MYKKTLINIVLSCACLLMLQACQEKVVTQPSDESVSNNMVNKTTQIAKITEVSDKELSILAKDLSILLRQDNFKEILQNSIKESKYVEQILEASEFINKNITLNKNGVSYTTTIYKELLKIDNNNEFIKS